MATQFYLEFEKPVVELEKKIQELMTVSPELLQTDIAKLEKKADEMRADIFANLTRWQTAQVARHPNRPYILDYIDRIFTDFTELHGDRLYGDDHAIVGGPARLNGEPVMVIGHQKGHDTKEKVFRNFGMPNPEGYPIITFVDTPGAFPGIGAEERGQAEAIARNLREMARFRVPIIVCVTGEGGSGGALAIAVGDRILMLEFSVYAVISPEGCAAILWSDGTKGAQAAEALKLTAQDIKGLEVIDEIVKEPLGGAHRDHAAIAGNLAEAISRNLQELKKLSPEELVQGRYDKFRKMSRYLE
jgi:acetyl-CoA carboxylase carboxyl transferase subunit alpha